MMKQSYEDHYVDVGGINTRFWTTGEAGTVIILLHGIMSTAEVWLANIPSLAENHRVYAMDLPGFGLTDKVPAYFISEGARFVDDFMKIQNIDRATLIGNSMGGGFALQYAIDYPDKVDRLVLVDSLGLGLKTSFFFNTS